MAYAAILVTASARGAHRRAIGIFELALLRGDKQIESVRLVAISDK